MREMSKRWLRTPKMSSPPDTSRGAIPRLFSKEANSISPALHAPKTNVGHSHQTSSRTPLTSTPLG